MTRPALQLVIELEGLAQVRVHAESLEDEHRLRLWLLEPACRRRLHEALENALDLLEAA
jgi:hypothetical protein